MSCSNRSTCPADATGATPLSGWTGAVGAVGATCAMGAMGTMGPVMERLLGNRMHSRYASPWQPQRIAAKRRVARAKASCTAPRPVHVRSRARFAGVRVASPSAGAQVMSADHGKRYWAVGARIACAAAVFTTTNESKGNVMAEAIQGVDSTRVLRGAGMVASAALDLMTNVFKDLGNLQQLNNPAQTGMQQFGQPLSDNVNQASNQLT